MQRERVVCFVNHTAEMGGAECALARLIAAMNRERWHPVVVFGEEGGGGGTVTRQIRGGLRASDA